MAANPGGLLAGLALLRGIGWGHTGLPVPEDRLGRLLGGGSVAIVAAAIIAAPTLDPWRTAFLGTVWATALLFVSTAILALALTRQAAAAGGMAAGWQRNPIWVVSMLTAVVTLRRARRLFSGQVRPTIEIVVGTAPRTSNDRSGLLVGWSKRGLRIFVIALAVMVVLGGFSRLVSPGQPGEPTELIGRAGGSTVGG